MSPGLVCRCDRLRTLVLVLEDLSVGHRSLQEIGDLAEWLQALACGAPALRALQLVLPMLVEPKQPDLSDIWALGEPEPEPAWMGEWARGQLGELWTALEALPNLASLTLGWVSGGTTFKEDCISAVLDAAQVGSAALFLLYQDMMPHCVPLLDLHPDIPTLWRQTWGARPPLTCTAWWLRPGWSWQGRLLMHISKCRASVLDVTGDLSQ